MALVSKQRVDQMVSPVVQSFLRNAERAGLSTRQMGRIAGVSGQTAYNWTKGANLPRRIDVFLNVGRANAYLEKLPDQKCAGLRFPAATADRDKVVQDFLDS